nr:hypothetical protein [Acetobacter cibinongensis]
MALSKGLPHERIAQDLGIIGFSTLTKWIRDAQKIDTVVADTTGHTSFLRENKKLRREVRLYRSLLWSFLRRKGVSSVWCQPPEFYGPATMPGLHPRKTDDMFDSLYRTILMRKADEAIVIPASPGHWFVCRASSHWMSNAEE